MTITKSKVEVVTTLVAYSTSPLPSLANIGNTANPGTAACIINVLYSTLGKLEPNKTIHPACSPSSTFAGC